MINEANAVIPTLSKGSTDLISSVEGILWHIVSQTLRNPGFTSDNNESEMVSFRSLEAAFGEDRETLKRQYTDALNQILVRYFPNQNIQAHVDTEDRDDNSYTLVVGFVDSNGNMLLSTSPINITNDVIDLDISKLG
jgi:hypothetical protein